MVSLFLWPSLKQVESMVRREPCEEGCELLSFLIAGSLDTINMVLFFQITLKMAKHTA